MTTTDAIFLDLDLEIIVECQENISFGSCTHLDRESSLH